MSACLSVYPAIHPFKHAVCLYPHVGVRYYLSGVDSHILSRMVKTGHLISWSYVRRPKT